MKRRTKTVKVIKRSDLDAWIESKGLPSLDGAPVPDGKEPGLFYWSNGVARNVYMRAKTDYHIEISNAKAIADLIYQGVITGKGKL